METSADKVKNGCKRKCFLVVCLSKKKPKRVKCPKCGFENLPDATFCSGCGARLKPLPAEVKGRFEALSLLLLVGSVYLFVSLAVNVIMQVLLFAVPSFVSAVFGVYAGYKLYRGKVGSGVVASSATAIGVGFAVTLVVFWLGLDVKGVFGPAWVIFLVAAWRLWKDRQVIKG